jgi:hypothetical protein
MTEEITDKQISQLEEKLTKLAELLTLRKIDWTPFDNNTKVIELLEKGTISTHFSFEVQNLLLPENQGCVLAVQVISYHSVGSIIFNIYKRRKIEGRCDYDKNIPINFFLPKKINYITCIFDMRNLLECLDTEISEQEKIISLLSK